MELFETIPVTSLPSWGVGDLNKIKSETYKKARQQFIELIGECEKSSKFVARIFEILDHLFQEYSESNPIACKIGCSACCLQLVSCTGVEMELIIKYLFALPRVQRREMIRRLKKESIKFIKNYQREFGDFGYNNLQSWKNIAKSFKWKYLGIPCVYLSAKGTCLIYKARPWNCRTAWSKVSCQKRAKEVTLPDKFELEDGKGQAIYLLHNEEKLIFEEVAIELIEEEQLRVFGTFEMVPIEAWPTMPTFSRFFF